MKTLIVNAITSAVNRVLEHGDPISKKRVHQLSGSSIAFVLSPFTTSFQWRVENDQLAFIIPKETDADCTLSGDFFSFMRAFTARHPSSLFQRGEMKIEGDLHTAERWFSFVRELNLDWEAVLSPYVGEFASVRTVSFLKRFFREKRTQWSDWSDDFKHYIQHEKKWVPKREEVRNFLNDIDELSLAEARLAERIHRFSERK